MSLSRWRRLISLSHTELRLLLEAAILVLVFHLGFALLPPSSCLRLLSRRPRHGSDQETEAHRLFWAAEIADRTMPGRSSCLRRAAALAHMLQRRGVTGSLRIGVARQRGELVAHAWVECEAHRFRGASESDGFTPLLPTAQTLSGR